MNSNRQRKRKSQPGAELVKYATAFEKRAPHCFMVPMMTEYEYVIMKGAVLLPHLGGDVKITRLLLEFILDCGVPWDNDPSWEKYPSLKPCWNSSMEFMEHFKMHGDHACVIYDPPGKAKRKLRKLKTSVYQ